MTTRCHIALLAALLPACAAETVEQPPAPPVSWLALEAHSAPVKLTDQERAAAEGYLKALASPKLAQLAPLLDELAHFQHGATDTHGRQRVVAAHEELFGSISQRSFSAGRMWLTNDEKAIEWTLTGVQADKPIALSGLTLLMTGDDASISDVRVYLAPKPLDSAPQVFEKSGAPKEKENLMVMRQLVQALQDNDETQFASRFTDREAARSWFKATRRSLSQFDTAIESAWAVEDYGVIEYSLSGRRDDRIVRMGFAEVGEIHDGKITRIWRYGR